MLPGLALLVLGCVNRAASSDPVVARAGAVEVTARQFQARAPELARRYPVEIGAAGDEVQRRFFLVREMLTDEIVLRAARRRRYQERFKDPQEMAAHFLEDEVKRLGDTAEVSEADIARYYADHKQELGTPERLRVLQIVTQDQATAERLVVRARGMKRDDLTAFLALVSEDPLSRRAGGDLGYLTRGGQTYPRALVDAAFALLNVFDVSEPVEIQGRFHVLKTVQRLPAARLSVQEAAPRIRALLAHLLVERKKAALAAALLMQVKNQIEFAELLALPLPTDLYTRAQGR